MWVSILWVYIFYSHTFQWAFLHASLSWCGHKLWLSLTSKLHCASWFSLTHCASMHTVKFTASHQNTKQTNSRRIRIRIQECQVNAMCCLKNSTLLLTLFLICQSKISSYGGALCGIHDTLGVFDKTTSCFSLTSYIRSTSSSLLTQISFFHSVFVT